MASVWMLVLWTSLLVLPSLCIYLDQASFYGNSFISIPLKEAKGYTDIQFKFRTYLPNALILLVAGSTDYCILRLDDGRLKLNINLGSGEFEVSSAQGVKLNDLKWHQVIVTRKEANLTLVIDNGHPIKKRLRGKFFELNIHYGLFVGGYGNFTDIFFGHQENFRGCLIDLVYNGISVLERVRHRQIQSAVVHDVTWNCAAELDADHNQPISFVNEGAYLTVTMPRTVVTSWHLELKTLSDRNDVVLFNTGMPTKSDTLLLELLKGKLRAIIKSGNNKIELMNDAFVADGEWHRVLIKFSSVIELNVDISFKKSENFSKHLWEFNDVLYIGGIDRTKRTRLVSKGLKLPESSFQGCIKMLKIGERHIGLKDAHVSEGLLNGCVWQYPCLTNNPCSSDHTCIQESLDSYRCECKSNLCSNTTYVKSNKVVSRGNLATDLELLTLESLNVMESQSTLITTKNLHIILDYPKYGINESGVIFYIVENPEYGNVVVDVWLHEKNSFTLSDISRDKVYYVHDGSESIKDRIIMEVEFTASDLFTLPFYLQGRFRLILAVNVTPVNDPPILNIPATSVLRLGRGTKKKIGQDFLNVNDPDGQPDLLVYNIVDPGSGHLEYAHKSGVVISSFTQEDVNNNRIVYVHNANASDESYLSLRVSDGIETSQISKLRISSFPHFWRIYNNTGLILMHQTSAVITSYNLSFISNVPDAIEETQYYVTQAPQFGLIELEKSIGVWKKTSTFTSHDLRKHQIRYRHTTAQPNYDEFQFCTNLNGSSVYTFRITLKKCNLVLSSSQTIELRAVQQGSINQAQLKYKTEPITATAISVIFIVTQIPKYGFLVLSNSKYRMTVGDTFTQEDIAAENIEYRLKRKTYSYASDNFEYTVMTPGCNNITGNVTVKYFPSDTIKTQTRVTLQTLRTQEGGKSLIDTNHVNIISKIFKSELHFDITKLPIHGFIQVDDTVQRNNTNYFTLKEISSNRVFYVHDDSESTDDSFDFVAIPESEMDDFQYVGTVNIHIQLKNDNSPIRLFDKIFNVVVNGEKLLTGKDLKYIDLDKDTFPSNIIITCNEVTNGQLYSALNTSVKITTFSQKDLDDGVILFKHSGSKSGKIKLWVTDGQFHVDGILHVKASAPFIRIYNDNKLITQQNKGTVISKEFLYAETNLFTVDNDIVYEIVTKPMYGKIIMTHSLQTIENFTQAQINAGQVYYLHEELPSSSITTDQLYLRVRCKDAINTTQIDIWILPASYWDPLVVKNLLTLVVEESTSASISRKILEISQSDEIPAASLKYYITDFPHNGYLSVTPMSEVDLNESASIGSFTQLLINENRLIYVQSKPNKTSDRVTFNITNGMVWLYDVQLKINIIPEHLYLGSNPLNLEEGATATVTETNLYVLTEYYKSHITEYVIVQQPIYGWLKSPTLDGKLNSFTREQLIYGNLQYTHDDSENLYDEFVVVAVTNTKRSTPVIVPINILPLNDQKPKLVNNTGVKMWEGGNIIITNSMLAAIDADQPPEIIRYQVLGCWWGNLSLVQEPNNSLRYFTQDLIDGGSLVYTHQNGSEAKFTFNISDGLHSSEMYSFYIKTKPVTLKLIENTPLLVFPQQKKQLSSKHLLSAVSDQNRTIIYRITTPPMLGRILIKAAQDNSNFQAVHVFTQNDINEGKIYYQHTHPFEDLYVEDNFIFSVESYLANSITNKRFNVDASLSSGDLVTYVTPPNIQVDEGGVTNIKLNLSSMVTFLENHASLKSPIIHASVVPTSKHGKIFLQLSNNVTTVTQQQLESGLLAYQHDHSDSLQDEVHLTLYLIPGYIFLCNITVPIRITPINDEVFTLITPTPHFFVVQGENHTITSMELCTEDADTVPADIHYDIVYDPLEGKLVLLPELVSASHFSQEDINKGRLIYIHGGESLTDSFNLRVWDGKFNFVYTVLTIQVIPVNLNVSMGFPIYLQQGSNVALLSQNQFIIETNADINKIQYNVKQNPKHGKLYVKESPATTFSQINLNNQEVMYMQTDMTTANDNLKVFAYLILGNVSIGEDVEIIVKVQPLMQIRNFTAITGYKNRLSTGVLDATPLAKLTNSNPRYTVIAPPQYGELRKIIRSSGETRSVLDISINTFTHEEIQSGLIYLVTKDVEIGFNGLHDEMQFILAATIFQPAIGQLKITIKSHLHNEVFPTLASPSNPVGREGGMYLTSPNMTGGYFLIVSMVLGVVILGVAVIVIIKCRTIDVADLAKEEQSMQPIPLPRPPDALMPTPSPIKQHVHDGFTSPIPARLPQCKVTPLDDKYAGYPYGIEEHLDDWSSCDASDPSGPTKNNVMLRRNQYWV